MRPIAGMDLRQDMEDLALQPGERPQRSHAGNLPAPEQTTIRRLKARGLPIPYRGL